MRVTPAAGQQSVNAQPGPDWKTEFDETARNPSRTRLTDDEVRAERLETLRSQDPVLDAAVRELDLDLID